MGNMGNMTGMDHSQHNMAGMGNMAGMDHGKQGMAGMDMSGMQVKAHCKPGDFEKNLGKAGYGSDQKIVHVDSEFGPQVDMRAADPANGLTDPGIGLRDHQKLYGRKVLTYADLCGLSPTRDKREPSREIQIHLTGNMNRYMWSIDGIKFADAEPVHLKHGERVRITLVNDTMMTHPIHLHGLWSELETGDPNFIPRKHTVLVQPGSKISYLVTADALGRWAYHCHLLYHMPGMFREVRVS
jgi:FtsP/CotA-like multicopper oxidase with cupredoxin domain